MKQNCLIAALLACTLSTFAHDFEVDGIAYNILTGDSVEVTYKGNDSWSNPNKYIGSIIIPEKVEYNSITYHIIAIGSDAFFECSELTSITIPNSIITIGWNAFYGCSNLTDVSIPESVISIGGAAFANSGIRSITITSIACDISGISARGGVFYSCNNLTSITIGKGRVSISVDTFQFCSSLESITVEEGNPLYYSKDNCLINKRTKQLMLGGKNSIIPTDGSVTSIGSYAFPNSPNTITIPNSVTSIDGAAFAGCSNLTSITIPNSVTSIGNGVFSRCTSLTDIPSNILTIGSSMFYGCSSLTNITIPNNITSIGENAFQGCSNLTSVTMNSVNSIGNGAFEGCSNLNSVTINNICDIGNYAFRDCVNLQSINIPNSISSIGYSVFLGCTNLQNVIIKRATPPSIGSEAFPINTHIIVPCGSTDAYWADAEWVKYPYFGEEVSFDWSVQSADETQGTVTIVQRPLTCDNPEIIIQAKPALGYQFDKWNDGNTDNPRKLVLSDGDIYTAYFVEDDGFIHVENVTLSESTINVSPNQSKQLNATITPANASVQNVTWSSSHPEVATISENGLLQAITLGTTTITVTTEDGGFTATCQVNVSVPVTNITLDETTLTLVPNKAQRLTATILPEDATNKNFTWKSSNEDVAIVLNNGLILALTTGNTTITATSEDGGLKATCDVTVTTVSGISLDNTLLELSVGNTEQLTETIIATEASYQLVNWTTSDANVATVENGLVTAVGEGIAAIGVATVDGGFVATCAVVVKDGAPSAVQQVAANPSGVQKVLVDGVLYIVKPNGEKYTTDGRKVE